MTHRFDRRAFLRAAGTLLVVPALSGHAKPIKARFTTDPFTLGVASGSPRPNGVVLWTRLAPNPLAGGGMEPQPVNVVWEVAEDQAFRRIVRHGKASADPRYAHSVHVEVEGLQPDHWYWYRFMANDAISPIGRTRTAPAPETAARMRFAFASCQQYEHGYFVAHRHMADEELDLVIFLGDYIYESSWGNNHVRRHDGPETTTLEQYRNRYALYKRDTDLQRSHAACPWLVTWDDHEVANDYANDRPQRPEADFLARRAAAYQAFYEHMPLRASARPAGSHMRLYGHYDFGSLARFYVLDDRQYRNHQACPRDGRGGSNVVGHCPERLAEQRSLLGEDQEAWLIETLKRSGTRWNVIAQQTLMTQLKRGKNGEARFWNDGWDGYPAARRRLLEHIARHKISNPLVVGGDVHTSFVADLKIDFDDPNAPIVATEFCGTSMTSQGPRQTDVDRWLAHNPHVQFGRSDRRGYATVTLDEKQARVDYRVVDNEKNPDSGISTQATFIVINGRAGATKI